MLEFKSANVKHSLIALQITIQRRTAAKSIYWQIPCLWFGLYFACIFMNKKVAFSKINEDYTIYKKTKRN